MGWCVLSFCMCNGCCVSACVYTLFLERETCLEGKWQCHIFEWWDSYWCATKVEANGCVRSLSSFHPPVSILLLFQSYWLVFCMTVIVPVWVTKPITVLITIQNMTGNGNFCECILYNILVLLILRSPPCAYNRYCHPRFGDIKCVRTMVPVKSGTEITVDYGYDKNSGWC